MTMWQLAALVLGVGLLGFGLALWADRRRSAELRNVYARAWEASARADRLERELADAADLIGTLRRYNRQLETAPERIAEAARRQNGEQP